MSRPAAHWPGYIYCGDPKSCCGHWWPVAVACVVDHERWPCATKRSHHTGAHAARLTRWTEGRCGRPPRPGPQ